MGLAKTEAEIAERASRYLKAELKRADMTYGDLAERLKDHGLPDETTDSVKAKLKRGTFPATFFIAAVAAMNLPEVKIEDL